MVVILPATTSGRSLGLENLVQEHLQRQSSAPEADVNGDEWQDAPGYPRRGDERHYGVHLAALRSCSAAAHWLRVRELQL